MTKKEINELNIRIKKACEEDTSHVKKLSQ